MQAVAAQFHSIPIARRVNASLDNIDGVSEQAVHSNVRTPGPQVQHADLNAFVFPSTDLVEWAALCYYSEPG